MKLAARTTILANKPFGSLIFDYFYSTFCAPKSSCIQLKSCFKQHLNSKQSVQFVFHPYLCLWYPNYLCI